MITQSDWRLLPTGFIDESEQLANYVKVADVGSAFRCW
jgi:hypothetical protein